MKKPLSLLLVLMLCISLVPAFASGEAAWDSAAETGTCGDGLTWTLDAGGTLTVTGSGAMQDFESSSAVPWFSSRALIKAVVLESGVTRIGSCTFFGCSGLTSVTVPDTVTTVGDRAFYKCSGLVSVTFSGSVTSFGEQIFCECGSLLSVSLPEGVTNVDEKMFYNCSRLTAVSVPASVTDIHEKAFDTCAALTSINIAAENGAYASENGVLLSGDKTELLCYPGGRAEEHYDVPEGVTVLADNVFSGCQNLKSVTLPNGLTTIGKYAFWDAVQLETVRIPSSVVMVEEGAFYLLLGLTVYYDGTEGQWNDINMTTRNAEYLASGTIYCVHIHRYGADGICSRCHCRQPRDLTGDGKLDATDLVHFARGLSGEEPLPELTAADINNDGKIDLLDLVNLMKEIAA